MEAAGRADRSDGDGTGRQVSGSISSVVVDQGRCLHGRQCNRTLEYSLSRRASFGTVLI